MIHSLMAGSVLTLAAPAVPPLSYIVDLADLRGTLNRPSALHRLTKAVEELAGMLGKQT